MLRGDQRLTERKESLEFKERDTGDMQAPLTPLCLDSWGFSVCRSPWSQGPSLLPRHNPASEAPATPQYQLGFGDGTNRQRQSRGKTHLTLNTAPEPEVPPWPDQESPRSQFQAQVFPLAPAAAGSQTLQSCRGSGGWLLGAGSTAAGPGIAPSAPTWNRGKGSPALLNRLPFTWPIAPGVVRNSCGLSPGSFLPCPRLAGWTPVVPAMAPALPHPC